MAHIGQPLTKPVDILHLLETGLSFKPDSPALASDHAYMTWYGLEGLTSGAAVSLRELGLSPGDRIGILLPNSLGVFMTYLAAFKAGLIAVPLSYRFTSREIDRALEAAGARAIIFRSERIGDVAASAQCRAMPIRIADGWPTYTDPRLDPPIPFDSLLKHAPQTRYLRRTPLTAAAAIFFTSGSVGASRGATHSVGSLGWLLASLGYAYGLTPDDVVMSAYPASHIAGFMVTMAALSRGATAVTPPTQNVEATLALIRRYRPTVLAVGPTFLFALLRQGQPVAEDLASLRLVVVGGDKAPARLRDEFARVCQVPITEIFAMTEVGVSHANPTSGLVNPGSVGRPTPGVTAEIRNDEGTALAPGEEGNMWLRAPSMMLGYWNAPEETQMVLKDGWFDTGDILHVDRSGYFWFQGRRKQIIVHDSSNIFPQEVEDALMEHPQVVLAGVVGVSDVVHGENVVAFVVTRTDAPRPSEGELIAFATERVGFKAPEAVLIINKMPLNPAGKVDRHALARIAEHAHEHEAEAP